MTALPHVSTLVLEVPDAALADALAARLEDRWACCAFGEAEAPVTVVFLSNRGDADFPQLLHRIATWVHEHDLGEIAMRLHGRAFIRAQPRLHSHSG
jgi:hypothetical protein